MNVLKFKDSRFSIVLGGINQTKSYKTITLSELLGIYQNKAIRNLSFRLSMAPNEAEKKKLKNSQPYFAPYCTYQKRSNANAESYNSELLAIDIDNLELNQVLNTFDILKNCPGCIFTTISARGKGIRALFYVKYENDFSNLNDLSRFGYDHYFLLEQNKKLIAEVLGIPENIYPKFDGRAFVFSQPFIISNNGSFFCNQEPAPLILNLIQKTSEQKSIEERKRTDQANFKSIKIPEHNQPQIDRVIRYKFDRVKNKLDFAAENRHGQIIKFQYIAKFIHYAPHLKMELKSAGLQLVFDLYGGKELAISQNAENSYNQVWDQAPNENDPDIDFMINSK